MARNRKSSPAEDVVEIVAVLPWWMGLALALVFYFILHSVASTPVSTTISNTGQVGQLLVGTLKKELAGIGQYLLPLLCLFSCTGPGMAGGIGWHGAGWTELPPSSPRTTSVIPAKAGIHGQHRRTARHLHEIGRVKKKKPTIEWAWS